MFYHKVKHIETRARENFYEHLDAVPVDEHTSSDILIRTKGIHKKTATQS